MSEIKEGDTCARCGQSVWAKTFTETTLTGKVESSKVLKCCCDSLGGPTLDPTP